MDEEILTLAELERRAILASIRRHNGNRMSAAKELDISTRTLQRRLKGYAKAGDFVPRAVVGCPKYVAAGVANG